MVKTSLKLPASSSPEGVIPDVSPMSRDRSVTDVLRLDIRNTTRNTTTAGNHGGQPRRAATARGTTVFLMGETPLRVASMLMIAILGESFRSFRSRLRVVTRPGQGQWLVPDPDTERELTATAEPFEGVRTAMGSIAGGIVAVSAATARKACRKLGVYDAAEPDPAADRSAAFAVISRSIADELARDHRYVVEHFGGRPLLRYLVATVGEGRAVLFQKVSMDGDWIQQRCFLLNPDHTVYSYYHFDV